MRILVLGLIISLSGCATTNFATCSPEILVNCGSHFREMLAQRIAQDNARAEVSRQKVRDLMAAGAMFPEDRAEVEYNRALQDLEFALKYNFKQ